MPIFEYSCLKCGEEFECIIFKDEKPECPKCGSLEAEKKMSTFGISVGYRFRPSSSGSKSSCSTCSSSSCSGCS
ncbi:MAG: zinc ribbon domain-containing protein [Desulfobacterota bacterium]|nr:zinc ribbon domain-containing protein [Thermodesulfobacteriota bacterium]MDW8002153.1 zinc ribbon domain-containing protein [Deltaproteobacteria bacterium]